MAFHKNERKDFKGLFANSKKHQQELTAFFQGKNKKETELWKQGEFQKKENNPTNFLTLAVWSEDPRKALRSVVTNSNICIHENWDQEREFWFGLFFP